MWRLIITYILFFVVAILIFSQIIPLLLRLSRKLSQSFKDYHKIKVKRAALRLDDMFLEVQSRRLKFIYIISPLFAALLVYTFIQNPLFVALGALLGIIIPDIIIKRMHKQRKKKFRQQLPEIIFTISSSLRAGLSLQQALEVLATDMSPPASQEFSLVVKAYKMGMDLKDALNQIKRRMGSDELKLLIMLFNISGETGGDVISLLDNLAQTIREREKLSEKIVTLTLQGRLQAYIMGVLPVAFVFIVRLTRPDYFDIFFSDPLGRMLLLAAGCAWILGMFLLYKLSKVEVY